MNEPFEKPIKVTVSDPETGDILESRIVENDYVLICAGNRYVKSVQFMGKPSRRTHMIAVAHTDPTIIQKRMRSIPERRSSVVPRPQS